MFTISKEDHAINKSSGFMGIICFAAGLINAQVVEKASASFTFPTTLTSAAGVVTDQKAVLFSLGRALRSKRKNNPGMEHRRVGGRRTISIFSVSGALVKKVALSARHGTMQADLGRAAAGVYFAAISFGSYRQNLKTCPVQIGGEHHA